MNNYYVYRITNIAENKHYYGSRKPKNNRLPENDLGVYYFSSSRHPSFKQEQLDDPSKFYYKIIFRNLSREDALRIECKLHSRFDVARSDSFYNLHNHNSEKFTCTPETGKKISAAHRAYSGKKISESHKKLFAEGKRSNKGENNPRFGDRRNYDELHGKEKAEELRAMQRETRKGAGNARAAAWKFTDPSGNEYIVKGECKRFCEEHSLSMRALKSNLNESVEFHKHMKGARKVKSRNTIGWKLEKL